MERLLGLTRTYEVILDDESMLWDEESDLVELGLISTSALTRLIHRLAHELISTRLPSDKTNVVVGSDVRHVSPVVLGERVYISISVIGVAGKNVKMRAVILNEKEKILEAELVRAVVDKNLIRRMVVEKATEI